MADRPAGRGVGLCPNPVYRGSCGCRAPCAICGHQLHSAIHMHVSGEKVGDPPFGHEFKPSNAPGKTIFEAQFARGVDLPDRGRKP